MKLALLGNDPRTAALLRAALEDDAHELIWCGELDDAAALFAEFPKAESVAARSEPGGPGAADAVIVATTHKSESRLEAMRLLAQSGTALCITHPERLTPIEAYELDMIRVESEAPVVPWLPQRLHPAIVRLRSWIAGAAPSEGASARPSPIGRIERITIERAASSPTAAEALEMLARDIDLCRAIAGDVTKLSAAGAEAQSRGMQAENSVLRDFSGLNVHLMTEQAISVRWSIVDGLATDGARMTLAGEEGKAVLVMANPWRLSVERKLAPDATDTPTAANAPAPAPAADEVFELFDQPRVMLAELARACDGQTARLEWLDAARAVDVADMVEVSLRRGRTVEIYNETYSEQGTFKGVMGMAGCGLVLFSLFVLLAAAIGQKVAQIAGADTLAGILGRWHYGLLAVLLVFLGLQLFRFAAPKSPPQRGPAPSDDDGGLVED